MTEDDKALAERLIGVREYRAMMYGQYDTVTEAAKVNEIRARRGLPAFGTLHRRHDAKVEDLSAENEKLRAVVDALLQHEASDFWGPDGEKNKRASYRGVIRKAKKARAALGETE